MRILGSSARSLRTAALVLQLALAACAQAGSPGATGPGTLVPSPRADLPYPPSEPDFKCPVEGGGGVIQGNGGSVSHTDGFNRYAWDWGVPAGTPVVAARGGVVVSAVNSWTIAGPDSSFIPFNNEVKIRHDDGTVGVYLHLRRQGDPPRIGEWVMQGERIGYVGMTGWTHSQHLHWTVHENGLSRPVAFADFPQRLGVPQKGDRHVAPPGPSVPQARIDRLKRASRFVARAIELELQDLAFRQAEAALAGGNEKDYWYRQSLEADRETLAAVLEKRVSGWLKEREPGPATLLASRRLAQVLRSSKRGEEILRPLEDFDSRFPAADLAAMKAESRALDGWIEGLEFFVEGEHLAALLVWQRKGTKRGAIANSLRPVLAEILRLEAAAIETDARELRSQLPMARGEFAPALAKEAETRIANRRAILARIRQASPALQEVVRGHLAELSKLAAELAN